MSGDQQTNTPKDFGVDRYSYVDKVRCKVGTVRTIRPIDGETNEDFQRRIDGLARELFERHSATGVQTSFELSAGGITQCVVDVTYPPKPEPEIAPDATPAGGKVIQMRGQRGHQRSA
jgi:hypothetical protein